LQRGPLEDFFSVEFSPSFENASFDRSSSILPNRPSLRENSFMTSSQMNSDPMSALQTILCGQIESATSGSVGAQGTILAMIKEIEQEMEWLAVHDDDDEAGDDEEAADDDGDDDDADDEDGDDDEDDDDDDDEDGDDEDDDADEGEGESGKGDDET
jgi:hypothetical protein